MFNLNQSPFFGGIKSEVIPVGDERSGKIYLYKTGDLHPEEDPMDIQDLKRKQTRATALLLQAARNYAAEKGVSEDEARKTLLSAGSAVAVNPSDYLQDSSVERYQVLVQEAVDAFVDRHDTTPESALETLFPASKTGVSANALDFLSREDCELYLELQSGTADLPYKAATAMMQFRFCYPCEVKVNAKAGSKTIELSNPVLFTAKKGDVIRFESIDVTLTASVSMGDLRLMVEPIGCNLAAEKVGYLVDFDANEIKHGVADWTLAHTRKLLTKSQIGLIYRFYQIEAGEILDDEPDQESPAVETEELGNSKASLNGSTSSPKVLVSTGANSTGDSNLSE